MSGLSKLLATSSSRSNIHITLLTAISKACIRANIDAPA